MKATIITAFLALCISYVAAQSTPFYITRPLQGDSFKAGTNMTIEWKNGVDKAASVALLTGTSDATMKYTGISFTVDGPSGEHSWKVPTDLPQNATFSFKIDYFDPTTKAAGSSYSAPFSLSNTTGDVVTQPFVSAIPSATSVSVPVTSASIKPTSIVSVVKPAVTSAPAASSPSPSSTEESAASGFKVATTAMCAMAFIASALVL